MDPDKDAIEEAKSKAEAKFKKRNLKSALKHAKKAQKLTPTLDGISSMVTAFTILRDAEESHETPDWYKTLQVEPFSHINTIKKQYKKLALALHPDKNPHLGCEDAFKLVGKAFDVLSDKIRRKEYDLKVRIRLQDEKVRDFSDGVETFWTDCSRCRLSHQFERKYLGHNLVCPSCKKSFVAVESEGGSGQGGGGSVGDGSGSVSESESDGQLENSSLKEIVGKLGSRKRKMDGGKADDEIVESVEVRKKMDSQRNGDGGSVERAKGLGGAKWGGGRLRSRRRRRTSSVGSVLVRSKARSVKYEEVQETPNAKRDNVGEEMMTLAEMKSKLKKSSIKEKKVSEKKNKGEKGKVEKHGTLKGTEQQGTPKRSRESNNSKISNLGTKTDGAGNNASALQPAKHVISKQKSTDLEIMVGSESEESQEASKRSRESKKSKLPERPGTTGTKTGGAGKKASALQPAKRAFPKKKGIDLEIEPGSESEESEGASEKSGESKKTKASKSDANVGTKIAGAGKNITALQRAILKKKSMNLEIESGSESEESEGASNRSRESKRSKISKRDVNVGSKIGGAGKNASALGPAKRLILKNKSMDLEIELASESEELEIMSDGDSGFYDFDKDSVDKTFNKGQVWAVYDDGDGLPKRYALIDEVVSLNPFELKLSWLNLTNTGDHHLIHQEKMGFCVSCGRFKVCKKASINSISIFSHEVECERQGRDIYRIFPIKGSVWALYNEAALGAQGTNISARDRQSYHIVICLTAYSEVHGLSIAYLDKIDGFDTRFKRKEIGRDAIRWLQKDDVRFLSHQIPAKKFHGDQITDDLGDCWELDPASLPSDLLSSC